MSSRVPSTDDLPNLAGLKRASLVSHPATAAALDAGYQQLLALADPDSRPREAVPPLLSFLSRPEIIKAVNAGGEMRASEAMMRDRWDPHYNYFTDLLEWIRWRSGGLWVHENTAAIAAAASSATTIAELVRPIANEFLVDFLTNLQAFKVEFLGYALLGEARLRDHSGQLYEEVTAAWLPVFENSIARFGGRLRPGVDLRDVIEIVTAVGDGLALREIVAPTGGQDRDRRVGLLATAVLGMIFAATEDLDAANPWAAG